MSHVHMYMSMYTYRTRVIRCLCLYTRVYYPSGVRRPMDHAGGARCSFLNKIYRRERPRLGPRGRGQ